MEARGPFKILKEKKKCLSRILYPSKTPFKDESEIKTFLNEKNRNLSPTDMYVIQEMLKEVFQTEGK